MSRRTRPSTAAPADPAFYPVPLRARYAETDQMGVVHHAVIPVWFEAARTELSRATGLPYREWERRGIRLMVTDLTCRYRSSARYDDEVTVLVAVTEAASRRVVFTYRVLAADGAVIAEGETRHLSVDADSGRPVVIPAELRTTLLRRPG